MVQLTASCFCRTSYSQGHSILVRCWTMRYARILLQLKYCVPKFSCECEIHQITKKIVLSDGGA